MIKTVLIILVIASSSLAISSRVRAQDAPTRPLQEPVVETASPVSPTPSESPTATPQGNKSAPRKTATTTPENSSPGNKENTAAKTEKTAAKTQSISETTPQKSATKIENKPSPEANKTHEVATAGQPQDGRSVTAKLRAMEKEWETSFDDPAVIEKSLADDFVGTSPDGKSVTKKSLLRAAKQSKGAPAISGAHHLNVYLYGPNIAVVVGRAEETVRNKEGKKVQFNYRFTDTWVEREGNWQCVASQAVLLPKR